MAFITVDSGELLLLRYILADTTPTNPKLHLFTNNYTPIEGTVLADLTECVAAGYAEKTLTGSSFTYTTTSGVSSAVYAAQTFTISESVNVYGYYITNTNSSAQDRVIWAERFSDGPYSLSGGGTIDITPDIRLA